MSADAARRIHRRFLNAYYRHVKHVYDASRKYFLFGRDRLIEELLAEPWTSLVEVGPGTGRNLRKLQAARPGRALRRGGGLRRDARDGPPAVPRGGARHGFAEDRGLRRPSSASAPERILFSYCLSMVQEGDAAL